MREIVRAKHLWKSFNSIDGERKDVIMDLSFSANENEILGIMGPSGCGKTTLLKMIGLLESISGGDLFFREKSVRAMEAEKKSFLRRTAIGFIFQDYLLMDSLTVEDNIIMPLLIAHSDETDLYDRAYDLGETLGISGIMNRYPTKLSGGEKQRVAICRALINNPDLILADEPTGNLDGNTKKKVIQEIVKINRTFHKTVIIVTHDPYVASFCDRVLYLKDGKMKRIKIEKRNSLYDKEN